MEKAGTIIFNYPGMKNVGGIEKYIANMSTYLITHNYRVIWFHEKNTKIAESFRKIMLDNRIEKIDVEERGIHWFKHPKVNFDTDESPIILSFTPLDMGRAIYLANQNKKNKMRIYYIVPDTTGSAYFIERYFHGKTYKKVHEKMRTMIQHWEDANAIYFFSKQQIYPLEENYKINIREQDEKVLPSVLEIQPLDLDKVKQRANRSPFTIITIGRFDFPHKGYMLGLIRSFGRLKKRHKNLKLQIIGFGPDKKKVIDEIKKLNVDTQKDIELIGEVAPSELYKYLDKASLNISVAGAVRDGGKLGVLSIPARNYCIDECEVYGFLPGAKEKLVSRSPGKLVDAYIERVISMSKEEYIQKSVESYLTYKEMNHPDPLYLFKRDCNTDDIIDKESIMFLKKMHYYSKIAQYVKKLKK